jgi:hypothetical protein
MKTAAQILVHTWFPASLLITGFAAIANNDAWALVCFIACCWFYGTMIEAVHG